MSKERISINRALAMLKLLDARIEKKTRELVSAEVYNVQNDSQTGETLITDSENNYKSVVDLIARRQKIKRAIIASNAVTQVTISGEVMSVADAIELKNSIIFTETLNEKVVKSVKQTVARAERTNVNSRDSAADMASRSIPPEAGKELLENNIEALYKANEVKAYYSERVESAAKAAMANCENFVSEVDHELTESNVVTFIEI